MTGLVVGGGPLVLVAHDQALARRAHEHLVLGLLEVDHRDLVGVAARGEQRGLVHEVLEIGAHEARGAAGEHGEIDVVGERHAAGVHLEHGEPPAQVGPRHHHAAVEAARAQQRRVEHVRPVGRGDQDHALVALEAVHLDQQLVERLLALVVPAAEAGAAMTADGVDLVDEDDAGRVLLALQEEIAHPRGAHAHEHLDEIRTRDREEGHARLAGHRAREQRLARARRPDQQHALRNPAAQARELLRLAQEGDDLLELELRLLDARHVLERHLVLVLGEQPRAGLAEAHRLAAARLHLADEEHPEPDDQQHREPHHQDLAPDASLGLGPRRDLDVLRAQLREQLLGHVRRVGAELAAVREVAADLALLDQDGLHLAGLDAGEEVAVGELGGRRSRPGAAS